MPPSAGTGGDRHDSDDRDGGDRHDSEDRDGGDRHDSDDRDGGDRHDSDDRDGGDRLDSQSASIPMPCARNPGLGYQYARQVLGFVWF